MESDDEIAGDNQSIADDVADDVNDDVADDVDDDDERPNPTDDLRGERLKRRLLTKNRLVCSIDTALDINNYNAFEIPSVRKEIKSVVKVDRNPANDVHYTFTNKPVNSYHGRQDRANVLTGPFGVAACAKSAKSKLESFHLFMNEKILNIILTQTNAKIQKSLDKIPDDYNKEKYPFLKVTNEIEIKALIGLMIYRGMYKLNTIQISKLFSQAYGPPLFGATISRNRFRFLISHFSFDDEETRDDRWKKDRFAAIREVFEIFNTACMSSLNPADYLSLDETLYSTRTQISFKQYNPSKPAKYGLLFKSINGARYPYTHVTAPYCGKPTDESGEYYVPGTENIVMSLVERLSSKVSLKGRNISFDRLYTSLSLELWLHSRNITSIGTMQINRRGIPSELKDVKSREPLSTEIYWQKDGPLSLSVYTVSTSNGKKNVLLLSTHKQLLGLTKDDKKNKPSMYKVYDFTKGGTDIVDQRMGFYTSKAKSRRWTMVAFSYILDMSRVNSSTIFALNNNNDPLKVNSFEFGVDLAMDLVKPLINNRKQQGLPKQIQNKIALFTNVVEDPVAAEQDVEYGPKAPNRGRCHLCIKSIQGENFKEMRNHISSNKSICQKCGRHSCKAHLSSVCFDCRK